MVLTERADAAAVAKRQINLARRAILLILAALQRQDCDAVILAAYRARQALAGAEVAVAQIPFEDARREYLSRILADLRRYAEIEGPITELRTPTEVLWLLAWNRDAGCAQRFKAEDAFFACLDLDAIDLRDASLARSRFIDCHFLLAALEGVSFRDGVMESCDFGGAKLNRASFCGVHASRCSFAGAVLLDAVLDRATFVGCDFRGADLSVVSRSQFATAGGASFFRCDLRGTIWDRRSLAGFMFHRCELEGARGAPTDDVDTVFEAPTPSKRRSRN